MWLLTCLSRAFQTWFIVVKESKITNSLCRHLFHSKLGLTLESGRKIGKSSEKRMKVGGPRTGRVPFEPQQMQTYPSNFLGVTRGMQGLSIGFELDHGSLDRFLACGSISNSGIRVGSWMRVSTRRRVRPSIACLTRVLLVVGCVFPLSSHCVSIANGLNSSNFRDSGQIAFQPICFDFFYLPIRNSN